MAIVENKKMNSALSGLLARNEYLVTQANDLARSFGNLSTFEHKVLDYCFSYVKQDDTSDMTYRLTAIEIIKHLGLSTSGASYARVARAFKALNEKTALYIQYHRSDNVRGILMTSLFSAIRLLENGEIEFKFNSEVAPLIFQLKEHYYSFRLGELSRVRSKYTLALMKIWNANARGKWSDRDDPTVLPPKATIEGTVAEWESWFLGTDSEGNTIQWPAGRFKAKALDPAVRELGRLYPNLSIVVTATTSHRRTIGYTVEFTPIDTVLNMNTLVIDGKRQSRN